MDVHITHSKILKSIKKTTLKPLAYSKLQLNWKDKAYQKLLGCGQWYICYLEVGNRN